MVYPIEPSRLLTCNVIALCPDAIVEIVVICLHVLILYFSFFVCYVLTLIINCAIFSDLSSSHMIVTWFDVRPLVATLCSAQLAAVPYVECRQRHLPLQHIKLKILTLDGRHVFILRNPAWVRQLGYCVVWMYFVMLIVKFYLWSIDFVIWTETAVVVFMHVVNNMDLQLL